MGVAKLSAGFMAGAAMILTLAVCDQPPGEESAAKVKEKKAGNPLEFVHLNEEGYPLNLNPEHVSAAEAPIGDPDMVMGVVINGEARAYPVNYMGGPKNEVVNDTLGGQAIAPSW